MAGRGISARARTTCSDFGFEARIEYGRDPSRVATPIQRLIEQRLALPSAASTLRLGELELFFAERDRLTAVGMYGRPAPMSSGEWDDPVPQPPPTTIGFPSLDASEHVHSMPAAVTAVFDMANRRLRATVGPERTSAPYLLADGLLVWIDARGLIAAFEAWDVIWTDEFGVG